MLFSLFRGSKKEVSFPSPSAYFCAIPLQKKRIAFYHVFRGKKRKNLPSQSYI